MELRIVIVFIFTLIIHLIGTLSYSVRLVGIKTGRIAVAAALFNVFALVSRFSHALQSPFLAKFVEDDIPGITDMNILNYFLIILFAASVGTLIGGIMSPTFQRVLTGLVHRFDIAHSVPKIIYQSFNHFGVHQIRKNIKIPAKSNISHIRDFKNMPRKRFVLNSLVIALLTAGSLASLYAAAIEPGMRLKVSSLVPLITGFATVMLVIFIDPYFSLLTDEIIQGKKSLATFHKTVFWLVISRFIGTLLAFFLLVPGAKLIVFIAKLL